ncbi:MAG TPA: hypothetical protein VGK67_38680 [Myxococcales bacterium]
MLALAAAGLALVVGLALLSIVEGFFVAWLVMLTRPRHRPHWLLRPLAWSTSTVVASCVAGAFNAWVCVQFLPPNAQEGSVVGAVVVPWLLGIPALIGLALLALRALVRRLRGLREGTSSLLQALPMAARQALAGAAVTAGGLLIALAELALLGLLFAKETSAAVPLGLAAIFGSAGVGLLWISREPASVPVTPQSAR